MDKITKAIEQFELLKQNNQIFNTQEILRMTCAIRDNILNDEEITSACQSDAVYADERRHILTELKDFLKNILEGVVSSENDFDTSISQDIQIHNFDLAKSELAQIARKEKEVILSCPDLQPHDDFIITDLSSHVSSIDNVINNCVNNRYEIVLLGEYQSGKTTTLDAFCGGLNIGAIGHGTKTSAVPLAVSFSNEMNVKISWKSEDELLANFAHISGYTPNFTFTNFRLSDKKTCELLSLDLENIRMSLQKNRSHSGEIEPDLQFLAICSIILSFYDTKGYQEQKIKQHSAQEIATLSRFPKNLLKRWIRNGVCDFSIDEIMFVFIKQIECGCPSQLLKDINGTIVDCPGLFANAYDSSVTQLAMINADAVLYILPYEKQSGNQIDKSLLTIKNKYSDIHRKLLVSNNLSFLSSNSKSIFETNEDTIKQYFGKESYVIPYDAHMAYLGEIKLSYEAGTLDEITESHFIQTSRLNLVPVFWDSEILPEIETFESAWNERTSDYAHRLRRTQVSSSDLIKGSKILDLANSIKAFIENNKAYSTIISKGAAKLKYELDHIRLVLFHSYVEPYLNTKESLVDQWSNRLAISNDFNEEVEKIVADTLFSPKDNNNLSLCSELSQKVYGKLFTDNEYDSLYDKICNSIFDHAKEIKKLEKKPEDLTKFMEGLVTDCITSVIKNRVDFWNSLIVTEQDEIFNALFIPQMEVLEMKVDKCWREKFQNDDHFTNVRSVYFPVPKSTKAFCFEEKKQSANVSYDKKNLNIAIALDYAVITTFIAGCVAAYALYLTACVAAGPIGWLVAGFCTFIGGGWASSKMDDYNRNKFIKKMKPELKKQIEASDLKDKIREMISSQIKQLLTTYQLTLKVDFAKMLNDRDIAISSIDNPSRETHCISAVAAIEQINKLSKRYSLFVKRFTSHEDD